MIILAVGAHPDDLEVSCAGTLAKLKRGGHRVVMCHATNGDKGHYDIGAGDIADIRRREAREAGAVIDCPVIALGLKDGEVIAGDMDARRRMIRLVRSVRPDIVITHAPNDYMPDHTAVSQLVFDAAFLATVPGFDAEHPLLDRMPGLYYMDNVAGLDFQPTMYVDIGDTFDTKLDMLRKHRSQFEWVQQHDRTDLADFVTTMGKMRGFQAGCTYAEAFIHKIVWARPNAVRFPV